VLLKKKIYAIVPARGGSKGIKLKNLRKIKNRSLIEITSNFIDACKIFDGKILNSDNKKILKMGRKFKFINLNRPKSLSGDFVSDYQLLDYTLMRMSKLKISADYLIYLQPTSPIRKCNHLLEALKTVIKKNLDGAWSVNKINNKFHPLKVLIENNGYLKPFTKLGKKIVARQMLSNAYIRNGIFYIFSVKALKKQKTIYLKRNLLVKTNYRNINIDNFEDLRIAKSLF
tara:strand:- start:1423 stop:2109 length:687 start_codon:yes stop_codon:yes gene_type:complete